MEHKESNGFQYTYSAREQEELKRIREKYTDRGEDKMERLRRLDNGVTGKAQAASLVFGILGALILGFGMSLAMSELGALLGLAESTAMLIGVAVGVVGGILASLAYPVYNLVLRRERKRIAPEILRLTDELMK